MNDVHTRPPAKLYERRRYKDISKLTDLDELGRLHIKLLKPIYRQTSNISNTLGNEIVDHSDVIGAAQALLQLHLNSRPNIWLQWIEQKLLQDTRSDI